MNIFYIERVWEIERAHESLARGEGRTVQPCCILAGPGRPVWCTKCIAGRCWRDGEAPDANLPFSKLNEAYQAAGTMWRVNINSAVQAALKETIRTLLSNKIQEGFFAKICLVNSSILGSLVSLFLFYFYVWWMKTWGAVNPRPPSVPFSLEYLTAKLEELDSFSM